MIQFWNKDENIWLFSQDSWLQEKKGEEAGWPKVILSYVDVIKIKKDPFFFMMWESQ